MHALRSSLSFDFKNLKITSQEKQNLQNEITMWVDTRLRKHELFVQQAAVVRNSPARDPDSKILYETKDFEEYPTMLKVFSRIQITIRRSDGAKGDLAVDMRFYDKDGFATYFDSFIERGGGPERTNETRPKTLKCAYRPAPAGSSVLPNT